MRLFVNTPLAGGDLNPLLQDPGLLLHPPMLYMGYVGFAVVFAFAVGGLLGGTIDKAWASYAKPWIQLAWATLTIGIILGSWWAYHVLGWGGWWFWDPVENASLLPWLTGTALMHSVLVTQKRGALKGWTVLLAILSFALSLLGTFLVRSGILISVHAFANDPGRGAFLLKYLFAVVFASMLLFACRAPKLKADTVFAPLSRETMVLSGNVILVVMMGTVMLGTLYPLVLDILNAGKISVGVPYFNAVFIPLALPLFLLMGIAPHCYWHQHDPAELMKQMLIIFITSIALALALPLAITYQINGMTILGLGAAFWILLSTLHVLWQGYRKSGRVVLNQLGMVIAHLGVAVCIIGVTLVTQYEISREVVIAPGESVILGPYDFYFEGMRDLQGANYGGVQATFLVKKDSRLITKLQGERRVYTVQRTPMSEVAIAPGFFRDLYLALGEPREGLAWSVRLYYKPFIRWIWGGGVMMMLGGVIAVFLTRRKKNGCNKIL